jgi:hypothetical protein
MANVRAVNWLANFLGGVRVPTGAGAGRIAVSDASGNLSWLAELEWEALEALNASLAVAGTPYAGTAQAAVFGPFVVLSGVFTVSAEIGKGGHLFTVPLACRPEKQKPIPLYSLGGANAFGCVLKTNGEVIIESTPIKLSAGPLGVEGVFYRRKG